MLSFQVIKSSCLKNRKFVKSIILLGSIKNFYLKHIELLM